MDVWIFPFCNVIRFLYEFLPPSVRQYFDRLCNWGRNRVNPPISRLSQSMQGLTIFTLGRRWLHTLLSFINCFKTIKFHIMVFGNDMNFHKDILKSLGIRDQDQVLSADQSDVIIAFVLIASRAGTDIETALQHIPEKQPLVFMALHHTFNPNHIPPESSRAVCRSNSSTAKFAVDLLFFEDSGILNCSWNTKALDATEKFLQDIKCNHKVLGWFGV